MIPEFKFALVDGLKDHPEFLPSKAHDNDVCYDVRCAVKDGVTLNRGEYMMVPLGFRMFAPSGWWLECRPRSSTFIKKYGQALYGVIDEGFEHQLNFLVKYDPPQYCLTPLHLEFGEKIAQLRPVKRQDMIVSSVSDEEFDRLCASRENARSGGFGSSGDK